MPDRQRDDPRAGVLAAEDEPHEVTAMYDNLGGLSLGLSYGTPVLDCSCGYSTPTVTTWQEAGDYYDMHLMDEGVRPDA